MGVGRRMKKQGPPQPLDESKVSGYKKRKANETTEASGKKRRTAKEDVKARDTKLKEAKPSNRRVEENGKEKKAATATNKKAMPKDRSTKNDVKPKKTIKSLDDMMIESDDDIIEDDEFDDLEDLDGDDAAIGSGSDDSDSAFDSDLEDDPNSKALFSEDEDDSDAEQRLTAANMEGLSRKLDAQTQQDAMEAQLDMQESALQTNLNNEPAPHIFNSDDDEDRNKPPKNLLLAQPDLQLLRSRINDTIRVLGSFSTLAEANHSRSDYTTQLLSDISTYYTYTPFLASKLLSLFKPSESLAFFDANETPRPLVIRTNTLRTSRRQLAQSLIARGVSLQPLAPWTKIGLQVFNSPVPLGATPEYLAGHYILQAASSFLPVMALCPQPHERVLDMAAAPGGKTTHIASLMRNTGCIFANDASKPRAKALIGNIHRLGVTNTIVCNHDAAIFPTLMPAAFDRVLLDAPCSGTGVISKDPSVKTSKTEKDFQLLPFTQKRLLLAAIDACDHASKTGGYVVYSTCSVTVEENEEVVNYALRKRPNIRIVDTGLAIGREGFTKFRGKSFDNGLRKSKRFYPHELNVDGFFVAKLKKIGPLVTTTTNGDAVAKTQTATTSASSKPPTAKEEEETTVVATTEDEEDKVDDFGGWEDEAADQEYIERARRKWLRRKGLDPRTHMSKVKNGTK
ncbi:MAG: rRNA (cytosine-C5-)-methyltransferase nop2 [Cirrosporium novae-zelandiae]|nr:MAG: rRNA (cytosine-C5-)-methyltransferase nop2 [Cirrosporium novae-zelandiae]